MGISHMGTGTRYVIRKKIADGGMAEIFVANQAGAEGFSRTVILKRILPGLSADPQFRDMLVDEAHIAMSLNHGNIVPVLDLGQAGGRYFLVMELVDGWDLSNLIRRAEKAGIPIPIGLALHIIAEVCRALAYAHAHTGPHGKALGLVHRDVSPHNVLIGEQGDVKLTDFGIAKALGKRDRTATGVIKGKLDFMSPEQASGQPLAPSSDIFAVGTILYLLATGKRPFEAASDLEVLLKVRSASFVPLPRVCPDLAPRVAAIIDKAMQRAPADRYPSAEAMMLAIEEALRADFQSPRQSELKRWLAELGARDHAPPTSRLPALPVEGELGPLAADRSDTIDLEETASSVLGYAETRLQDTGSKELDPTAPPPLPARASPPPLPAAASGEAERAGVPAAAPRGGFARFVRAGLVLAALGGVVLAATELLPPRTRASMRASVRASVVDGTRGLWRKVDVGSLTEATRSALANVRPPAPRGPEPPPPAREPPPRPAAREAAAPEPPRPRSTGRERSNPEERARRPAEPRAPITVRLVTRPPGAQVLRGNGTLGRTPLRYTVRSGGEVLRFAKAGYLPASRKISGAQPRTIVVDLRRKSRR